MAALAGGRLIVHCINRKNAPFLFFHMTGDTTPSYLAHLLNHARLPGRSQLASASKRSH